MAGVKRRLDAAHGSATSSRNNTSAVHSTPREPTGNDSPNTRVTRNLRSSRDARASQNDNAKNANNTANSSIGTSNQNSSATTNTHKNGNNRPSRIITLKYGPSKLSFSSDAHGATPATPSAAAPTSSVPTNTRETRNSRARAAASSTPAVSAAQSRVDGAPSVSAAPETPTKRFKRGSVAEESPRTTRQSARLKGHIDEAPTENGFPEASVVSKPEASPLAPIASNTRTRNRTRHIAEPSTNDSTRSRPPVPVIRSPPPGDTNLEPVKEPKPEDVKTSHTAEPTPPIEESPKGTVSSDKQNNIDEHLVPEVEDQPKPTSTRSSPILSRKRKSIESVDRDAILSTTSSPSKRPKLEEAALDRAPELTLQNGDERTLEDAPSLPSNAANSRVDEGFRHITEEADDSATPDNTIEFTIAKATRGGRTRGRGRGARNRTSARFGVTKRGRGGTRAARSGRTGRQNDRSSDIEFERSPSPSAATQKLRDRQRELDKAFRRVAAAQRLALAVLATQSEKRLARDKNAHKAVPEYDEISELLKTQLREKQETLRRERDIKVAQENRLFKANKDAIEDRYRVSARCVQEEHLLASHGEYMTFIEGRRAAEDDEHTETDGSETENERGRRAPVAREVYRGFTSSFVRDPAGANSYERAALGWDDFVQRAKLGDDIDPQMKEMRESGPFAGLPADEVIKMLLEAMGIVEVRDGVPVKEHHPPTFIDRHPTALAALADIASAEVPRPPLSQHTPRLSAHRAILPQPPQPPPPIHHAHPEPRPFVLPPLTPRGGPRRILPAAQQIPPINEPLGLPDPFSSRGGPPQLPPPPGSNFQRPPLPGYLTGHHHPSLYYHPPPPPPPRPPY